MKMEEKTYQVDRNPDDPRPPYLEHNFLSLIQANGVICNSSMAALFDTLARTTKMLATADFETAAGLLRYWADICEGAEQDWNVENQFIQKLLAAEERIRESGGPAQ